MIRQLYSFLFYISLPFLFCRLWWKGIKTPAYRQRWSERLGYCPSIPPHPAQPVIWIHAVSLGEVLTALPFLQGILHQFPLTKIVLTTTTMSGSSLAQHSVNERVSHVFLPYDTPSAIQRFLNRVHPTQVFILETELWPNLLYYTHQRNISVFLINARLSERSMKSYRWIRWLTQTMCSQIKQIAAQSELDANRFQQIGARPHQIKVLGNLKFDLTPPEHLITQGKTLRAAYFGNRPTLIAASTHKGEEEIILEAFAQLKRRLPHSLLVLVPRHPERFDTVWQLCQKQGFKLVRRSQWDIHAPLSSHSALFSDDTHILLGDSIGELFLYYALAQVAFVGGSFIPVGGHNLLEPAALGLPILTGPHWFNFTQIVYLLQQAGAVKEVSGSQRLTEVWQDLLTNPAQRAIMGNAAQHIVLQNQGALQRHLEWVDP